MRALILIPFLLTMVVVVGCKKSHEAKPGGADVRLELGAGVPRCTVRVIKPFASNSMVRIDDTLRKFASNHALVERKPTQYDIYSGPGYLKALFGNEKFAIWCTSMDPAGLYRASPKTTNYSAEFVEFTNSMIAAFEAAFPGRVEINPTNTSRYKDFPLIH